MTFVEIHKNKVECLDCGFGPCPFISQFNAAFPDPDSISDRSEFTAVAGEIQKIRSTIPKGCLQGFNFDQGWRNWSGRVQSIVGWFTSNGTIKRT